MKNSYDDIIHLPRPISKTRPQMPLIDRAAQFSPFAALTGFEAAVRETARLTDEKPDLDESVKEDLNRRLRIVADHLGEKPEISITYFQPDARKEGGAYLTAIGTVKKIDEFKRLVVMNEGPVIPVDDIIRIEGEIFEALGMAESCVCPIPPG